MPKHIRRITCLYSEASLRERSGRTRGAAPINQVEHMYLITNQPVRTEVKNHRFYNGTNLGETIGFVRAPKWLDAKDCMRISPADAKDAFGRTGILIDDA